MDIGHFDRERYLILAKLDQEMIALFRMHGVLLCGGAITSIFTGAKIRDWDLYFPSEASFSAVREAFIQHGKEQSRTDLAMTYTWKKKQRPFQLIWGVGYFDEPMKVYDHYDYTICMGGFDFKDDEFFFHRDFLKHLAQRRLVFNHKTDFPMSSLLRSTKYLGRGYFISGVELLKLAMTIQATKITTYKELRRQMMGIDTAFLKDLTDRFLHPDWAEKSYDLETGLQLIDEYMRKISDEVSGTVDDDEA